MISLDIIHPVGSVYETFDKDFDPNVTWGGTWSRDTTGSVLVSSGAYSIFEVPLGTVVGSDTAVSNVPQHSHTTECCLVNQGSSNLPSGMWGVSTSVPSEGNGTWTTTSKGSGQAHENRMRSIYVIRWIRTA